jgi:hypothetical protein
MQVGALTFSAAFSGKPWHCLETGGPGRWLAAAHAWLPDPERHAV